MGVLRLVCGAEAHVAEDRARLLEPPWVRGWYQIVRNLELVILVVERPCSLWMALWLCDVSCLQD